MTPEQAVTYLAQGILAVRPLALLLPQPVHVAVSVDGNGQIPEDPPRATAESLGAVVERLSKRLGAASIRFSLSPVRLTVFEQAISNRLGITPELLRSFPLPQDTLSGLDDIVTEFEQRSLAALLRPATIKSFDGAPLCVYEGGSSGREAVVVVVPCGYPVELCEHWQRHLSLRHHVLTWETRGLFPPKSEFDSFAHDVEAHARDLLALMDHADVGSAHIMGLCGGAVVALAAAALHPRRVSSLSLWHGDYEFGQECPKTQHQQNLQALQDMAQASRARAASLWKMITVPRILANLSAERAPLMLYPYATPELFFRYATLNGQIMSANATGWLNRVRQPVLVVTSEEDMTAHPEGSRHVARRLPNVCLRVRDCGVHLSLFDSDPALTELADRFLHSLDTRHSISRGNDACAP